MPHYVCQGACGAVFEEAGVCHDENCTHYNRSLEDCLCGDDTHAKKEEGDPDTGDLGDVEDNF